MNHPTDFHSTAQARSTQNVMVPFDGGCTLINGMPITSEAQLLHAYGKAPELVRFLSPVKGPTPTAKPVAPSPLDFLEENDLTDDYTPPAPRPFN